MATDVVGLKIVRKAGALDCHTNWLDNIRCLFGFWTRKCDPSYFPPHTTSGVPT